ncbi:MAG: glycosyltransferase [Deltaproteobacteria bacterium]|nr:MAG: glycosyltransferase [Deltaproteobacteria bacterium]
MDEDLWRREKKSSGPPARKAGTFSNPTVSVIMPLYDSSETVCDAVESVVHQSFTDWELLIVDDGSRDGGADVVRESYAEEGRIRLFRRKHRGVAAARNAAMSRARGQIFAFLDADNVWRREYLSFVVRELLGKLRACCHCDMMVHKGRCSDEQAGGRLHSVEYDRNKMLVHNQIDLNTFAHTADLYHRHGGFDTEMSRLVDWDYILRITSSSRPRHIAKCLVDYYDDGRSGRISLVEPYHWNRFLCCVKNRLGPGFSIVVTDPEPFPGLHNAIRDRGLPCRLRSKSSLLFGPVESNSVLIWGWSEHDEREGFLGHAARRIVKNPAISFYWIPDGRQAGQLVRLGLERHFDFIVVKDENQKSMLAERIRSVRRRSSSDDSIDTILVASDSSDQFASWTNYLDRLEKHFYPRGRWRVELSSIRARGRQGQLGPDLALSMAEGFRRKDYQVSAEIGERDVGEKCSGFEIVLRNQRRNVGHPLEDVRITWLQGLGQKVYWPAISGKEILLTGSRTLELLLRRLLPSVRVYRVPPLFTRRKGKETGGEGSAAAHFILSLAGYSKGMGVGGPATEPVPTFLYLHGDPRNNSTRKRCFEIAETLRGTYEIRTCPHQLADEWTLLSADVIVIQRWAERAGKFLDRTLRRLKDLKSLGKLLVYEIDDYILEFGDTTPLRFIEICDAVITSTPYLAKLLGRMHPRVFVLPNGIDFERLEGISPADLGRKKVVLCGSTDAAGMERFIELAESISATRSDVSFHFISSIPDPPRTSSVVFHGPLPEHLFMSMVKGSDIVVNLAEPSDYLKRKVLCRLPHNKWDDFLAAKSEVKYQYAGLAAKVFVTDAKTAIYRKVVRNGFNGFIASSKERQRQIIERLLDDGELRAKVGHNAREDVLRNHTLAARFRVYKQVFGELTDLWLERYRECNADRGHMRRWTVAGLLWNRAVATLRPSKGK